MRPHYRVKHRCSKLLHNSLEFITIRLRVRHPSVERPPYSEEGTAAQVPKEDQCQELTAAKKQARMTRARQLLNQYPNLTANFMLFLLTKSYSSLLPEQLAERSFLHPSGYQKERQRKPTPSNEIDIQQVSRWTLDRCLIVIIPALCNNLEHLCLTK